ncbi:hypothetical protein [Secundilactobacillus odoratitofui]|uniref:hypothetical protein n=1 Tax=Secundilactobacillus odoratitofui TaxID=480930 RepID=UPI0006D1B1BC|nr:hypothetical protein [Secundilactobacillus odoratitofui]
MNYHSILRGTIIAFSVTAIGACTNHPTAQAASWHKGVPSTIKGTFTNSWFRTDMGTTQGLIEFTNSRFTMSSNLSDLLHAPNFAISGLVATLMKSQASLPVIGHPLKLSTAPIMVNAEYPSNLW